MGRKPETPKGLNNLPTVFQKKALWTAITALALTVTAVIAIGLIYTGTRVLAFLQPFLVPFAVAGVLAYLLEPGVVWLEKRGLKRHRAVLLVFAAFTLLLVGMGWWLGSKVSAQAHNLDEKLGVYSKKVRESVVKFSDAVEGKYGIELLPPLLKKDLSFEPASPVLKGEQSADVEVRVEAVPTATPSAQTESTASESPQNRAEVDAIEEDFSLRAFLNGEWVRQSLPGAASNAWKVVRSSLGGFLGAFGFVLSMVIVPLYLYYFLMESARIKLTWSNYLPLRASAFKDELVNCLTEINGYLIAFFRGQLFVSLINGMATGIGLMIAGLDFGLLIGLLLCALGIIPYLGIALCWIPAVAIAAVQGGSALVPGDPWWMLPLVVTIIFAVVQQIDALWISPKIVGGSVGLHPMTVIVSVLVWSLLLGGLLGAILAVPLTASVKVLFQRYVWLAKLAPQTVGGAKSGPLGGVP
jgi:predicted PurR-regulated permease PerM